MNLSDNFKELLEMCKIDKRNYSLNDDTTPNYKMIEKEYLNLPDDFQETIEKLILNLESTISDKIDYGYGLKRAIKIRKLTIASITKTLSDLHQKELNPKSVETVINRGDRSSYLYHDILKILEIDEIYLEKTYKKYYKHDMSYRFSKLSKQNKQAVLKLIIDLKNNINNHSDEKSLIPDKLGVVESDDIPVSSLTPVPPILPKDNNVS